MVIVLQLNNSNGKKKITFQKLFAKKVVLVDHFRNIISLIYFHKPNKNEKKSFFVEMLEFLFSHS